MNRSLRSMASMLFLCGSLVSTGLIQAAQEQHSNADNTKVNKRDRNSSQPTADQAKNNQSDREIMRQIRKEVVGDKNLSTYGHNVKIVSQNGKVTLKGPVHSEEEKKTIEEYARKVAGDANVSNEITVKADSKAESK